MTLSVEIVAVIAGLVALSQGLMKIIQVLIGKWKTGKKNPLQAEFSALCQEEHDQLQRIFDICSRTDDSGSFLVYVPRSLAENQKQIVQSLTKSNMQQDKTIYVLEKLVEKLERKNG